MQPVLSKVARQVVAVALSIAVVALTPNPAIGTPASATIEAKKAEAAGAQRELDALATQLELRGEEHAVIDSQLQSTRAEISQVKADLVRADRDLAIAQTLLSERAERIYRGGQVDLLEVLLGTTSFEDFITRMDWLRRVSRSDASLVAGVKEARQRVTESKNSLERREQEQIVLRDKAAAKRREVEDALAAQKAFVGGLNAEVAKLVEEERLRQEKLAEERARAAAEAAAKAKAKAKANSSTGAGRVSDPGGLGSGHPEAVDVGLKYVGVPYVWGGASPDGFDCSGLTHYVYAQIGISISRSSRAQFKEGAYIAPERLDLLMPGDLVFFGYGGDPDRVHHVGIYVGSGNYLHAPMTGQNVQVSSLTGRIASSGDYVGAVRF
ncbi:MAG: NlpC/P60 family protein [Actinomycetota bacterium]|nr:NlpC/P60 family protein [Actinomycetota bacterium]